MKDGAPLGEQFVFPLLIVSREFELNQVGAGFNLRALIRVRPIYPTEKARLPQSFLAP